MTDLAMHMMDIAQNSIRAKATRIKIDFIENSKTNTLIFRIKDDGSGMNSETVAKLSDPFFTTRITRRVGLGVPFLKMTAEQTGGTLKIESKEHAGTLIEAMYKTDHPDCLPLGDIAGYLTLLLKANPEICIAFCYQFDNEKFSIDSEELKTQEIDLRYAQMVSAVKEYIHKNLKEIQKNRKKGSFLCE